MENKQFKAGDRVYHYPSGEWVTLEYNETSTAFNLKAQFKVGGVKTFTKEGMYIETDTNPVIFHNEVEIVEKAWSPKEGELCWFWDEPNHLIVMRFKTMFHARFQTETGIVAMNCAPFNGELPEGVEL